MRHKHADVIHAWADGAEIEIRKYGLDTWELCNPQWAENREYRVAQPDVVRYAHSYFDGAIARTGPGTSCSTLSDNLKLTFSPDGKLKSAEVLK